MRVIAGLGKGKGADKQVVQELTRAWLYFDGLEFAEKVLAPAGVEILRLDQMSLLPYLPKVPSIRQLALQGQGVDLRGDQLPSLRPLGELPLLEHLSLYFYLSRAAALGVEVADLSPIGSLTGLTSLTISGGRIGDLSFLRQLPALQQVTILDGEVADLSPLAECKLKIVLYDTKPAGADGPGFLPVVEQRSGSYIKSAVSWVLRR